MREGPLPTPPLGGGTFEEGRNVGVIAKWLSSGSFAVNIVAFSPMEQGISSDEHNGEHQQNTNWGINVVVINEVGN